MSMQTKGERTTPITHTQGQKNASQKPTCTSPFEMSNNELVEQSDVLEGTGNGEMREPRFCGPFAPHSLSSISPDSLM